MGPNGMPLPPFPLPPGMLHPGMPPVATAPPPSFVPGSASGLMLSNDGYSLTHRTSLIPPAIHQYNPEVKKATLMKYEDANHSPEEKRALHKMYQFSATKAEESRGVKRPRAEDFL